VIEVCAAASKASGEVVEAVNFNAPGQIVIAGASKAVAQACEMLKAAGAKRALPLPVSAPFHSSLLKPASDRLKEYLQDVQFKTPTVSVINNVDVIAQTRPDLIKDALVRQAAKPVRWQEIIRLMSQQGVKRVVECGPGKVLAGLTKRIDDQVQGIAIFDETSLQETVASLK
jgi:[acyl-carrier-protein] S-malonyltransferase